MHLLFTSAANSDYTSVNSSALTFTSGQSSSNMPTQCRELVILNDDILEYDENFMIQLASRSDEVEITTTGEQADVVIREDTADCKSILQILPHTVLTSRLQYNNTLFVVHEVSVCRVLSYMYHDSQLKAKI